MTRRVVELTLDTLADLPAPCRGCAFWELDPVAAQRAGATGSAELEKEAWVSDTLLQWGTCGQLLYVDGAPAGYATYAPPGYVPRAVTFPTSPTGPDAVLLMTARLLPEYRGCGLGRMLMQGVVRDVARRGLRAVEAFGSGGGAAAASRGSGQPCLLPADYLRAVGFKTVRPHPNTPRLRLDVRSTLSWKADVGHAWDRLLSGVHVPALSGR